MNEIGKLLILTGIIIVLTGIIFVLLPKMSLFKLPGDIYYKKGNFSFYFPFTTGIIISLILTLLFNFLKK